MNSFRHHGPTGRATHRLTSFRGPTGTAAAALLLVSHLLSLGACYGDPPVTPGDTKKVLKRPSPSALAAAESFEGAFGTPIRVFFSQNSGEILWLDAQGNPLVRGTAADLEDAESAATLVRSFFETYPELYRIQSPDSEIVVREHPLRGVTGLKKDPETGHVSLRFEQARDGIAVGGHYGIAFFDAGGNLVGLVTQLKPTSEAPPSASEAAGSQSPRNTPVAQLPPVPADPYFLRRYWRNGRLLDEYLMREPSDPALIQRVVRDAYRGEIVDQIDETSSLLITPGEGWAEEGSPVRVQAFDALSLSHPREILSTRSDGALVLGFRIPDIHAQGSYVSIADAASIPEGATVLGAPPIASDEASWTLEPDYNLSLRDATRFAENLERTFLWFKDKLGWDSWDGRGGTLHTAIRANRRRDGQPDVNAYASVNPVTREAILLVGDGKTKTGQALSDAPEIVAHEFAHAVISFHVQFMSRGESGALAESLADIFGMSVAGFDPDPVYGAAAGLPTRHLSRPATFGHPETYDEYIITESDRGGIHFNNGIMNRALSQLILGFEDGTPGPGSVAVTRLLLRALGSVPYSQETTLEEFAAATSAFCRMIHPEEGVASGVETLSCPLLEKAFEESELLVRSL